MKENIKQAHPLLKLILPLELALIAYLVPIQLKVSIAFVIAILVYMFLDHAQKLGTLVYIITLSIGYSITAILAHVSLAQWFYGLLNFVLISLILVLFVVLIEPYDMDYFAIRLRFWSKHYLILRTTLIVFKTLLRDVAEAMAAVKAKHRGRLVGLSSLRYTAKMIIASMVTANMRILELAEMLQFYPPKPIIKAYNVKPLVYVNATLLVILALLLTNLTIGA